MSSDESDYNQGLTNVAFDSSDDDDDVKRKVVKKRTANERLIVSTLDDIIQNVTDDEYENVPKGLKTVSNCIKKIKLDWGQLLRIPKFYCMRIAQIRELLLAKNKKSLQKELQKEEFKIFTRLQNDWKQLRHVDYQERVFAYIEDPAEWANEGSDPEDEEEDDEDEASADEKSQKQDEESEWEAEDSDNYSAISAISSDDADSGSDSGDDKGEGYGPWSAKQVSKMKQREFWVVKETEEADSEEIHDARIQEKLKQKEERQRKQLEKMKRMQKKKKSAAATKKKKLTTEEICKKLKKIWLGRHKKSEGSKDPLADLEELKQWISKEHNPEMFLTNLSLSILMAFDSTNYRQSCLSDKMWAKIHKQIHEVLEILEKHNDLRLHPSAEMAFLDVEDEEDKKANKVLGGILGVTQKKHNEGEDDDDAKATFEEQLKRDHDEKIRKGFNPDYTYVRGQLEDFCMRFTQDWILSLKNIQKQLHSEDYAKRLKDQDIILALLLRARAYMVSVSEKGDQDEGMALIALQELEIRHSIYIPERNVLNDPDHPAHCNRVERQENHCSSVLSCFRDSDDPILELAKIVWRTPNERHRRQATRATLYVVFYLALHNDYRNARDLLQMSHLSPSNTGFLQDAQVKWYIGMCEPSTQVIFNRCISQLALAAFCHGRFQQCMTMFMDLYHSGKIKELMGQGVKIDWWKREKTEEEMATEASERARLLPDHLHFNTDLLESVHLISAMFVEIPNWITNKDRRSVRNKSFRKYFENYLRKDLTGPSSNTRFTIMEAGKAMSVGDWQSCYKLVAELKFWNELNNIDIVRGFVKEEVKRQCLRCYLEQFGPLYKSIQMSKLCERFEFDASKVQKYISRFCIENNLPARYDQIEDCYVIIRGNATPIQKLSLSYVDKFNQLVETNEKLMPRPIRFNRSQQKTGGQHSNQTQSRGGKSNDNRRSGGGNSGRNKSGQTRRSSSNRQSIRFGK